MMKNCKTKLFGLICLALFAFMLQGCLTTEECTREGLTVYTNNWPEQNWSSICIGGWWRDTPISERTNEVFSLYPDCKVILCYEDILDCECNNDIYPVEEREKHGN